MKKAVQLLLLTARVPKAHAAVLLDGVRRGARGVRIHLIAKFPGQSLVAMTRRQTEVLGELAVGTSVKEIAVLLGISVKTVETHRAKIMKRLGTRRVPELVRTAIQCGLVPAGWLTEQNEDRSVTPPQRTTQGPVGETAPAPRRKPGRLSSKDESPSL